jgi:nucleotidyltransferase/DNA polymerase involved in DNA repair
MVASCNYVARSYGIHNGMTYSSPYIIYLYTFTDIVIYSIGIAKRLCPNLQVIP